MSSLLVITSVEKLQKEINKKVKSFGKLPGIYVSLNKTQESTENLLKKSGINTKKLFFIDCVTSKKTREDVLHISPNELELLSTAIKSFIDDIRGDKFLVIDALSTLLIYNSENEVARFAKKVTEHAARKDVKIIDYIPKTKAQELLNMIVIFVDKVKK